MTCSKRMEERIIHFAAGELPAVERWLLQRHLRACGACRNAWSGTTALRRQLRALTERPTDPALDARVLGALSAARPAPRSRAPRKLLPARVGLVVGAAALAAAGTFPLWGPLPGVAAGDVRAGLAGVESWHGQGWKTVEGRKVEWEVWGRRAPYLYWARVGDQIRFDNGRERLEVTAASRSGRSGFVLRTRSRLGLDDWTIHPDRLFAAGAAEPQPAAANWRTSTFTTRLPGETTQAARTVQFVVDRKACVPIRYVIRPDNAVEPTESLALDYGAALPPSVTQPNWPQDYRVIDLLRKGPGLTAAAPGMATAGGFSAQATPLAIDRAGNVLVRVRGWLGGMPLDAGAPFMLWVSDREVGGSAPAAADERGRKYRYVPLEGLRLMQHLRLNGDRLMLFAPARPLDRKTPRPRRLTLTLNLAAAPSNQLNPPPGFDSVSAMEELRWHLALPEHPAPLRLERWVGKDWQGVVSRIGTPVESIEAAVARLQAAPKPKPRR